MATVSYDIYAKDDPFYRSCDGKPMADNNEQYRWIVAIQGGLSTQFLDQPDVLVVGNCLWYPVEGSNKIRVAPDVMAIFGRPKGDRGSYIQYREEGIAPQVVFEILSPGNRAGEMRRKLAFYQQYGVEEYYILDPDFARHKGYLRSPGGELEPIAQLFGHVSPRLGARFEMTREMIGELRVIGPDGRHLEFYEVEAAGRQAAERQNAIERRDRVAAEQQASIERREREAAEQQAAETRQEIDRLRAKLRALGLDPDA